MGGLLRRIVSLWWRYIRGQFLHSVIMGLLTSVVGSAIGLRWALLLGLLAGLFETVPGVGALLAAIPAAVVALWKGSSVLDVTHWTFALIVIAAYVAIQQVGELVVKPRLLGRGLGLHPIIVLCAILIGTLLAGIPGAYLAIPIVITVREFVCFVRRRCSRDRTTSDHESVGSAHQDPS